MIPRSLTLLAVFFLVTSTAAPAVVGAQESTTYDGQHVQFSVDDTALIDYRVDGTTFFERIAVQSKQQAEQSGVVSVGADVSSLGSLAGSGLSLGSTTDVETTVRADSGATLDVHDNTHGIVVFQSEQRTQYLQANLSETTEATYQGDATVLVETESGPQASVFVVGEGSVGVNDDGDLTATVGPDGYLVVRTYEDERGTDDRNQEQLIADGVATGEVYLVQRGGETVVDTVAYGRNTTVEVTSQSADALDMTVDRAVESGTVILTSIPQGTLDGAGDGTVNVTVDGEVAGEALTYGELQMAAGGGQTSKYLVQQSSNARATTEVGIALNHFSERQVTIRGDDGDSAESSESTAEASQTSQTSTTTPGFGAGVAVLALLATLAGLVGLAGRVRRRD
ncbi:hypothetical protein SAMN04487950_1809 [Halogranum rubrum]|uniref:PGF-CTERM protein n=1 Tax=Halogranum rubrum TaxID=553466 RepID=A0A1I4E0U1_9EURY|nr:hypothetical protein [Halogranum rubrum]SFK99392.1 hypothetical protein SAMN04487950_1809 [Halogranum rubrum]